MAGSFIFLNSLLNCYNFRGVYRKIERENSLILPEIYLAHYIIHIIIRYTLSWAVMSGSSSFDRIVNDKLERCPMLEWPFSM